jgi:hypothetical protein
LRRHPEPVIGARAERKVERELFEDLKRVTGKQTLLFELADAAVAHPEGVVREVVFPGLFQQRYVEFHSTLPMIFRSILSSSSLQRSNCVSMKTVLMVISMGLTQRTLVAFWEAKPQLKTTKCRNYGSSLS